MKLFLMTPTETLVEAEVSRVTAEAEDGSFCLLPRHIDFAAGLVPSVLSFVEAGGGEAGAVDADGGSPRHVAIDRGVLVKCGDEVLVSVRRAVLGEALESLHRTVQEQFRRLDEQERSARSAIARLEAGAIRRFAERGEDGRG